MHLTIFGTKHSPSTGAKGLGTPIAFNDQKLIQKIALALLQQVLPLSFARSLMVITSQSNQAAQLLLEQAGFLPERRWQSMRLGGVADLRSRQWLYGYANLYVG
jgi:hypothetical protein